MCDGELPGMPPLRLPAGIAGGVPGVLEPLLKMDGRAAGTRAGWKTIAGTWWSSAPPTPMSGVLLPGSPPIIWHGMNVAVDRPDDLL